jgi:hypothetical protein
VVCWLGSATDIENRILVAAGFSGSRSNSGTRAPKWKKPWGCPANSPITRIKVIAATVERIGGDLSLSGFFVDQVKKAVRSSELTNLLSIDQSSCKHTAPAIGKARAKEIVVNVLLPFATALGLLNGDIALARNARKAFFEILMLSKNSLTTEAEVALSVGHSIPPITGACQQQGLIVLYREMTRSGIRSRQLRFEDSQSIRRSSTFEGLLYLKMMTRLFLRKLVVQHKARSQLFHQHPRTRTKPSLPAKRSCRSWVLLPTPASF